MKSVVVFVIVSIMGLLFTVSSGLLTEGYTSLSKNSRYDGSSMGLLKGVDRQKLLNAAQKFIHGLKKGMIDGKWLKAHGLDKDLLKGVDRQKLLDTTQKLIDGLKKGMIDQKWIRANFGDYSGGFVLILVLFILLVIIGAGFGIHQIQ